MKVSIIPMIIKKLKQCFAFVEDGTTASQNIAKGKYVLWKGNMCTASSAISSGDALSSSNLTAVEGGALNALIGNTPRYIYQGLLAGSSYSIDIEDGKAYLITLMASSTASQQTFMITRRSSDIQKAVLFSGSYSSYFTDSISDNKWTITANGYFTAVNIIIF